MQKNNIEEVGFKLYAPADKEQLINFLISIGVDEFDHGPEWIEYFQTKDYDQYINNGSVCYIVKKDNEIIATCALRNVDETTAELESFYVEKEFRGTGLAEILYDWIMRFAKKKNYKTIELCTHKEFFAAVRFYEKRGYELYGVRENQGNIEHLYKLEL